MASKFHTNIAISDSYQSFMEDYVDHYGINPSSFKGDIHPDDEMFHDTLAKAMPLDIAFFKNMESGRRTMEIVVQLCNQLFGGVARVGSILDFASGYGRLTRYLVAKMPSNKIVASDIYADAVKWQKDYFGVEALQSKLDPADFHCDRRFDLIIVGSLFSHLPDQLFQGWLAKLASLLTDRGALCISVGDSRINVGPNRIGTFDSSGILFEAKSESRTLPGDVYGRTIVTEAYVSRIAKSCLPEGTSFRKFRSVMYEFQDVYVFTKNPALRDLRFTVSPLGAISGVAFDTINPQMLRVYGWAVELNEGASITNVVYFIDDVFAAKDGVAEGSLDILAYLPGETSRPVQWSSVLTRAAWTKDTIVRCRIISDTGGFADCYVELPEIPRAA